MKAIPLQRYVLCSLYNNEKHDVIEKGVFYKKTELPLYKVERVGELDNGLDIQINDIIVTNSNPTEIKINDVQYFLINQEYISGIVLV